MVATIVQTVARLDLQPPPPVAVIPLGTGNDLSRCFGWGPAFTKAWIKGHTALHKTLSRVAKATPAPVDRWRVCMTAPSPKFFSGKRPYGFVPTGSAAVRLPACMCVLQNLACYIVCVNTCCNPMLSSSRYGVQQACSYAAEAWNYISVGMDAKAAQGFHHLRDTKPSLAFSRAANQFWYASYCVITTHLGCCPPVFLGLGPPSCKPAASYKLSFTSSMSKHSHAVGSAASSPSVLSARRTLLWILPSTCF